MDNPTLAELADKVPALARAGIRGLADDDRLGLVIALAEGGKMTFSEIKAKYGLDPGTLSSHLNALQSGNLVRNHYEKGIGRAHSYYEATDLPEAVIGALLRSGHGAEAGKERPPHPEGRHPWALWNNSWGESSPQPQSAAGTQSRTAAPAATRPSAITIPDNDTGVQARYGDLMYKPWIKAADGVRSPSARGVDAERRGAGRDRSRPGGKPRHKA